MRPTVTYFSDVLCVWAYVSQIRLDQLAAEYGDDACHQNDPAGFRSNHGRQEAQQQWRGAGCTAAYALAAPVFYVVTFPATFPAHSVSPLVSPLNLARLEELASGGRSLYPARTIIEGTETHV